MGFFDKVKEIGAQAADAAKDAAEVGKYKLKIAEAENGLKSTLVEIGKKLLAEHPEVLQEFYPEELVKLNDLQTTIASLKEQIESVKADDAPAEAPQE